MKRIFYLLAAGSVSAAVVSGCDTWGREALDRRLDPVDYVNILVGTQSKFSLSAGNTYPAVAMPWGMNFWTPQTGRMGDGWQYTYTADKIRGFKQTHQPSPWINDYGQFSIMPTSIGPYIFDEEMRASWFSHKSEVAKPYYYSVYLADHDITAEMTPTERACFFRFTFPEEGGEMNSIIVDAFSASRTGDFSYAEKDGGFSGSWVKVIHAENRVVGYTTRNSGGVPDNFRNWFVIQFDRPIAYHTLWLDGVQPEKANIDEVGGDHAGAIVSFNFPKGRNNPAPAKNVVYARVASSFISLEQAERNLEELGRSSASTETTENASNETAFDEVVARGRERWNEVLGRIEFPEADKESLDDLRTFYSCLYRSLLFPRDFSEIDADGNRVHYSPYNGEILPGEMFTDAGFWDTFRSLFPLLNLLYPEMNARMQAGLVNAYLESGFLPEWASPGHRDCMVGNNSASVVTDGWLSRPSSDTSGSNTPAWDIETLWEAVIHGANASMPGINSTGRLGWEYYNDLGYVPCDVGIRESAARTLEYAYNDWCIWQLGRALGKPESEIAPYARRALNYKNLFDPETRLMRGRNRDGSFQTPFNPLKWGDAFTEGNSLHYSWSVFHDPAGLIELMGGASEFTAKLDGVFTTPPAFDDSYYGYLIHEIREMQVADMGNYAHGNQPIQHMIYLYDWAGEPWKAQKHVRDVMRRLYSATPDGYPGDEDNGQTSAWYVFSALGFYPVCPGSGEYALGSPLFRHVVLHLPGDKQLTLHARDNSPGNVYVNSVKVNGKLSDRNFVTREELTRGGKLTFEMSPAPNPTRGTGPTSAPYSFSRDREREPER